MSNIKYQIKSGFSLIEVLVVMFIAAVAFTSFYSVSVVGTKYIIESKNRLGAVALANEKMEIIRNLAYDKVGTQGSIDIAGNILQEEDVTANGKAFHVSTSVRYFDDPMDGAVTTSPADTIPNDYKVVRVIVSWIDSNGQSKNVSSTSRFVPPGMETSVGGSPLSINVIDGITLLPISQASIHITNSLETPPINDTIATDNDGHIILPAARISNGDHLSITKNGYEAFVTMDASATFVPIYGHINVVSGFLNTYNYFINKLVNLTVKSADYQNNPVGDIDFSIEGGKIIGHSDLGNNVFSTPISTGKTDAVNGEKNYPDILSGNYTILMSPNTQYEFIDFDPATSPTFLSPENQDAAYTLRVADKNVNSLFLEIKNTNDPPMAISGAKVTLSDGAVDIFTEKLSSMRGVIFYPDDAASLEAKEYTLKIVADGYEDYLQLITIDKLTHLEINLIKI